MLSSYSSSACKEGGLNKELPSHRCPTRSKKYQANTTLQLEQKKMKEYLPATLNFSDTNAVNLPNQLKHENISQGPDEEKWQQGMSN